MKAHDEVCGMSIDAENAAATIRFQGKTYYFCSDRCRGLFKEHPDRYVPVEADGHSSGGRSSEGHDHHHHH